MLKVSDYDSHPEIHDAIRKVIEEHLKTLMGSEFTTDWVDLIYFYTSSKCKSTREEVESDLKEMMGVY